MKNALTLIVLLTLAACESSESSKSKSCTLNGQAVDCSTFENGRSSPQRTRSKVKLTSKVSTSINLENNTFETLENTQDRKSESVDGDYYECETETKAGERHSFRINGNQLVISNNEYKLNLERVEGTGNTLTGSWTRVDKAEGAMFTLTLNFAPDKMTITTKCEFN